MTATFMAKFNAAEFGSSCHVHQSLWEKRTGHNLFRDPRREHRISSMMRNYAAGLLEVLTDFTLMWAPYVNSYKRLGKNTAAGLNKTWGIDNRTVSIRVLPENEDSCRLEHRVPGADANPYLVMAAMLAGGLYGIENALDPPQFVVGNAYDIPAKDAPQVPKTLGEAVSCFLSSPLTRGIFGKEFVEYYAEFKIQEWNQFCSSVTDWEIKRYLAMA